MAHPDPAREWIFCPVSGFLLDIDARTGKATCNVSNYSVDITSLPSTTVVSSSDIQAYRRKYGITALAKTEEDGGEDELAATARATVSEQCPKCGHEGLEFYTMQLRSADEGQTVFYECPQCRHKYSQNT